MSNLVYALNINGEGSARVTFAIIADIIKRSIPATIVISSGSLLHSLLFECYVSSLESNYCFFRIYRISRIRVVLLSSFFRLPFFALLIKAFFPISIFNLRLLVMDDYPFLIAKQQLLFFQQANLLLSTSLFWKLRRYLFSILLLSSPLVFLQTSYMQSLFLKKFPNSETYSLVLKYD